MFASTNHLRAGPEFPFRPSVCTVIGSCCDPRFSVLDAFPLTRPGVAEVNVTVVLPVAFVVAVNGPAGLAFAPFTLVRVIVTDSPAALTQPEPRFFSRCAVNVCGALISFVASGVIEIRASTNVFTAGPLFGATPFVARLNTTPPIDSVDEALPVTVPPVAEVNVTWH